MDELNLTIAKITHEIRNPLTLINSSLQLIETMHPEVRDFQFWNQTLEDVDYLGQLLEDLAAYTDGRTGAWETFFPPSACAPSHGIWKPCEIETGLSESPQKCL